MMAVMFGSVGTPLTVDVADAPVYPGLGDPLAIDRSNDESFERNGDLRVTITVEEVEVKL